LFHLVALIRIWQNAVSFTSFGAQIRNIVRDALLYSNGQVLTKLIVSDIIFYLPRFWDPQGILVEIDDELIDFNQKGGWAKLDSATNVHPGRKKDYRHLLKKLDVLTEGVRVGIDNFSLVLSRRKLTFFISCLETKSRGRWGYDKVSREMEA
jgi:hypothetical protein